MVIFYTTWMLEIEIISFYNTFAKVFGHINPIAVMEEVDTFGLIVLPIIIRLIEIGTDVGTQLSLEFQLLFCLQNLRSQRKRDLPMSREKQSALSKINN